MIVLCFYFSFVGVYDWLMLVEGVNKIEEELIVVYVGQEVFDCYWVVCFVLGYFEIVVMRCEVVWFL